MAEVRVRRIKEVQVTGKNPKREEKDYTVHIEKIGEEGGATVSRSRSLQQGMGLEFGAFKVSISDTATVTLSCKQTLKHIKLANKIASQLRDKFLEEDSKESGILLKKLMKAGAQQMKAKAKS